MTKRRYERTLYLSERVDWKLEVTQIGQRYTMSLISGDTRQSVSLMDPELSIEPITGARGGSAGS